MDWGAWERLVGQALEEFMRARERVGLEKKKERKGKRRVGAA